MSDAADRDRAIALQARLRRIRGQLSGLERAVSHGRSTVEILHQAGACRGALIGFIGEVLEAHVREMLAPPASEEPSATAEAGEELIRICRSLIA